MSRAVLELVANTQGWDGGIKKAIQGLDNFVKANGGLHNALANNEKLFIDAIGKFGDLGSKATTMSGRVNELSAAYLKLGDMLNQMSNAEKKVHGATIIANMKKIRTEVLATKDAMNKLNADLEKGNKFGAFGAIFQGNLAAGIAMQAVRQLGQVVKDAVQTNIDFEQSNATLASILGTTTDNVKKLTENAALLGATTVWTAGQISELQQVLARRGFDQNQILAMTKGISSLATATGVGLADAAELAASAIQAFQLPATKMDDVVATLGVATTKSALDMEKLKYAFAYVAPAAKAAGFSIEEAVSMLGALADAGLPATTAGMATRNIMLDLTDSSSRLSKALGKPVHSLDEFITALEELKEKGGNNLETIGQLVDDRVVPAFSVFLNSTEKMVKMREEVTNVRDELQAMVDNQINTLQGSLTLFTSAWDGLMLSFQKSNGPMKTAIDGFTQLINKLTEYQKKKNGVDVSLYENGVSSGLVDYQIKEWKKSGMTDKQIIDRETKNLLQYTNDREPLQQTYDMLIEYLNMNYRSGAFVNGNRKAELEYLLGRENIRVNDETTKKEIKAYIDSIARRLAFANDKVAYSNYVIQSLTPTEAAPGTTPTTPLDLTGETSKSGKTKSRFEQLSERIAKAEDSYAISLNSAAIEVKNGSMTEKEYLNRKLSATQQLYRTYVMVISEIEREIENNPALKGELTPLLEKLKPLLSGYVSEMTELSGSIGVLVDLTNKQVQDEKEAEALRKYNAKIVKRLSRYANRPGIGFEAVGLNNLDLTKAIDFQAIVDALNQFLAADSIKINLDLETGNIEEIKFSLSDALGQFDSKIGAFSTIINSVDNIKSSFESLSETINSDASVWDKWFAVFNFGIGVLQTVIGVLQAIETLKEANIMLSQAQTAANANEAASDLAVAGAASTEASANAAAAASGAGSAVAGIPIIGPMLAVAAIAAVVAAIASAFTKTEYHAQGGIAGDLFTPRGTDTIPAMLSPGELILNRSQQASIASQLQGQGYGAIQVYGTSRISGGDILIALDNTNRARGGSRGTYAYSK